MDSRMSKYDSNDAGSSRLKRNAELYKEINDAEIDNFNVNSNAAVLGNQEQEIDIEKIKKILDTRYNSTVKRKSIKLEDVEESPVVDNAPTKEYDLNIVLENAKDNKEESYEEARAKKLRNTQFDILKNLNIDEDESDEELDQEEELKELINTITMNETKSMKKVVNDDLELLSDLKGDENTEVIEGLKEQIEIIENSEKKDNKIVENDNTTKLDKSFYTTTNMFNKSDFSDSDFEDEKISIWVKLLIVLLVLVFIAGIFIFLKTIIKF